ncbi:MAG: ATP-binding protein [Dehalococcoidia bacterium]|nr:ATP-binding protein [Dehalococcoidia bacterium]
MRRIFPFSAIVGQEHMKNALLYNAVDPSIGGVLIRGEKGTGKSTAVRAVAEILPPRFTIAGCRFHCHPNQKEGLCPECQARRDNGEVFELTEEPTHVVDLPLNASEDRVVGSIDIETAIKSGQRRFEPGILSATHRAILYVDEVNLLDDHIVDILLDVAVTGVNVVEREGVTYTHPSRFILVGTMNPEEGELRPQLLDRFGLCVDIQAEHASERRMQIVRRSMDFQANPQEFLERWQEAQDNLGHNIRQARDLLPKITPSDELLEMAAELSIQMQVDGHRAEIIIVKTALASAAFNGRTTPSFDDVREAAILALAHRVKRRPLDETSFQPHQVDSILQRHFSQKEPP